MRTLGYQEVRDTGADAEVIFDQPGSSSGGLVIRNSDIIIMRTLAPSASLADRNQVEQ